MERIASEKVVWGGCAAGVARCMCGFVRGLYGGCAGMLVSVKVHEKLNHVALHSISPLL